MIMVSPNRGSRGSTGLPHQSTDPTKALTAGQLSTTGTESPNRPN